MKKRIGPTKKPETKGTGRGEFVDLRLYVTNSTPRCLNAYENIRKICEENVTGAYRITVIDLLRSPEIARRDNITAIPTLVRLPRTLRGRKIIGMLTDTEKVIEEMDLKKMPVYRDQGTVRKNVPAHAAR
ncbi:MAG TPA: circadian clock KaiB family protein [Methanoregula sp.]|nr:circadian clock KaiB family protein [Methanoregula sp.]